MVQLDVGRDGNVWGVDSESQVFLREGISPSTKSGTHWVENSNDGRWSNVAVCTDGHVWAVSSDNKVFYRTRVIDDNQQGEGWALAGDSMTHNALNYATQVTCAGGKVAIMGTNNQIFMRTEVTNDLPQGKGWAPVVGLEQTGKWEQVTLGENGHMWMLSQNQVYRYTSEVATPGFKAI
jgi:hypothetical protein